MAVAFVSGAATTSNGSALSLLGVPFPASIAAGNLLVVFVTASNASSGTFAPSTGATGFTKESENPTNHHSAVFTKVATGSESGSASFAWTGSSTCGGVMLQYSGASGLDGASVHNQSGSSTTTATIPSITPTATGDMWMAAVGTITNKSTMSTPGGFTQRAQSIGGSFDAITGWDQGPLASASATGTATSTLGTGDLYNSVSVLVAPTAPPTITGTVTVALGPLTLVATSTSTRTGTASVALGPVVVIGYATTRAGGTCNRSAWLTLGTQSLPLEDSAAGYFCEFLDLGFPAVREVVNNRPDQDGIVDRTQYFGSRAISANITTVAGAAASIDAVAAAFAPYMLPSARPVLHYVLARPGLPERTLTVRGAGYSWPIAGPTQRNIQLAWVAADPIAYDPAGKAALATLSTPGTITTAGDVPIRPLFRVTGPLTNIVVTMSPPTFVPWTLAFLASFTLAAGHFVEIDTDARTVYLDGNPALPRLSSLDWTQTSWQSIPAATPTTMTLTGTGASGATQVTATWQDGYLT